MSNNEVKYNLIFVCLFVLISAIDRNIPQTVNVKNLFKYLNNYLISDWYNYYCQRSILMKHYLNVRFGYPNYI